MLNMSQSQTEGMSYRFLLICLLYFVLVILPGILVWNKINPLTPLKWKGSEDRYFQKEEIIRTSTGKVRDELLSRNQKQSVVEKHNQFSETMPNDNKTSSVSPPPALSVNRTGGENIKKHQEMFYQEIFHDSSDKRFTDVMSTTPLNFLPNFKNPCWIEKTVSRSTLSIVDEDFIGKIRCLPYFFLAGFPKCGTTDIYRRLENHPDIIAPCAKEPHWWTRGRFSGSNMDRYLKCFDGASFTIGRKQTDYSAVVRHVNNQITMDCSASTFWDDQNWKRIPQNNQTLQEPVMTNRKAIRHLLPDAKFVVVMRNPTDRLYSDYMHFSAGTLSPENFHSRTILSIDLMKKCLSDHSVLYCIQNKAFLDQLQVRLHIGLYSESIRQWFELYPREQFLFLKTEEYSQHISEHVAQILDFLNLDQPGDDWFKTVEEKPKSNTRPKTKVSAGPMLNQTRAILNEFYLPFNRKLRELLEDARFFWS